MAGREAEEQRYQDMTVAELRRRARAAGVAGRSRMRKQELVRALRRQEAGRGADDAMTRSEETLRVGRRKVAHGRARLRKTVENERVTATVPVEREEPRLEREPITDANVDAALAGPDISEAEHEVVLHQEQPVVRKEVVPKERVRLGTEKVKDQRRVARKLRKEKIGLEEDPPGSRR